LLQLGKGFNIPIVKNKKKQLLNLLKI